MNKDITKTIIEQFKEREQRTFKLFNTISKNKEVVNNLYKALVDDIELCKCGRAYFKYIGSDDELTPAEERRRKNFDPKNIEFKLVDYSVQGDIKDLSLKQNIVTATKNIDIN